jgi:hypothetical protein
MSFGETETAIMHSIGMILVIVLSLILVPGNAIRVAILANSLDNFTNPKKVAEKNYRLVKRQLLVSGALLVVSLLVIWLVPTDRPWAYAALGLLVGFWGKFIPS